MIKINNFSIDGSISADVELIISKATIEGVKLKDFIKLAGLEDSIIAFDSCSAEITAKQPELTPTMEFAKFKIHSF
jgi:hypothetical protein